MAVYTWYDNVRQYISTLREGRCDVDMIYRTHIRRIYERSCYEYPDLHYIEVNVAANASMVL